MRTGITHSPLHGGTCPPWLFVKMKQLGAAIIQVIVTEYGTLEVIKRLSDPVWFQTLGCVLGFDWHSSGLTTVLCGALKEGMRDIQGELGIFFAGGKGKVSRHTPLEIDQIGEKFGLPGKLADLKRTSKLVAKVDSAAVQDGYQLYHHFFIFDAGGNWAVVQQGMNPIKRYARRYHWLSDGLESFVVDPHQGICGMPEKNVLNLVSHENEKTRKASVELCRERPELLVKVWHSIQKDQEESKQLMLWQDCCREFFLPARHSIPNSGYLDKILYKLYENPPQEYEELLETSGVGPSTLRALAMVAEVTHGAAFAYQDPVRYTFAHGGKDGFPFPVRRKDYEHSINALKRALEKGKIESFDKLAALRKLAAIERNWTNYECNNRIVYREV